MRVLVTSFVVLFGLMELSYWLKHFTLPLPLLILSGAFLAIASNYGKSSGWSFSKEPITSETNRVQTLTAQGVSSTPNRTHLQPSSSTSVSKPPPSISFTIHRATSETVNNNHP